MHSIEQELERDRFNWDVPKDALMHNVKGIILQYARKACEEQRKICYANSALKLEDGYCEIDRLSILDAPLANIRRQD